MDCFQSFHSFETVTHDNQYRLKKNFKSIVNDSLGSRTDAQLIEQYFRAVTVDTSFLITMMKVIDFYTAELVLSDHSYHRLSFIRDHDLGGCSRLNLGLERQVTLFVF